MTKEEIKGIFDYNRKFIPLREILDKEEMEDRVKLARILAVYDTYHIRKRGILETVYLFFSTKRRGSLGIIKYISNDGEKRTRKQMYHMTKELVISLIHSEIYCKLIRANWFPSVYCGK